MAEEGASTPQRARPSVVCSNPNRAALPSPSLATGQGPVCASTPLHPSQGTPVLLEPRSEASSHYSQESVSNSSQLSLDESSGELYRTAAEGEELLGQVSPTLHRQLVVNRNNRLINLDDYPPDQREFILQRRQTKVDQKMKAAQNLKARKVSNFAKKTARAAKVTSQPVTLEIFNLEFWLPPQYKSVLPYRRLYNELIQRRSERVAAKRKAEEGETGPAAKAVRLDPSAAAASPLPAVPAAEEPPKADEEDNRAADNTDNAVDEAQPSVQEERSSSMPPAGSMEWRSTSSTSTEESQASNHSIHEISSGSSEDSTKIVEETEAGVNLEEQTRSAVEGEEVVSALPPPPAVDPPALAANSNTSKVGRTGGGVLVGGETQAAILEHPELGPQLLTSGIVRSNKANKAHPFFSEDILRDR